MNWWMRIEYTDNKGFALSSFLHLIGFADEKRDRTEEDFFFSCWWGIWWATDEELSNWLPDAYMHLSSNHQFITHHQSLREDETDQAREKNEQTRKEKPTTAESSNSTCRQEWKRSRACHPQGGRGTRYGNVRRAWCWRRNGYFPQTENTVAY